MSQSHHQPKDSESVEYLLDRMRLGDRAAAAQFITRYENRIRRRIRKKLNPSIRRLFDSHDIFPSIGRRLDQYVQTGKLEAQSEDQLWALIFRMATNAVIDKSRMYSRLQKAEGLDSQFAQELMSRFRQAERNDKQGVEIEIDNVVNLLSDDIDREILTQWLFGSRLIEIAQSIGMAHTGVRKRWRRIRSELQEKFLQNLDSKNEHLTNLEYDQDEQTHVSDCEEIVIEFETKNGMSNDQVKELILDFCRKADAYHRALGGKGLKIKTIESESGVSAMVPV